MVHFTFPPPPHSHVLPLVMANFIVHLIAAVVYVLLVAEFRVAFVCDLIALLAPTASHLLIMGVGATFFASYSCQCYTTSSTSQKTLVRSGSEQLFFLLLFLLPHCLSIVCQRWLPTIAVNCPFACSCSRPLIRRWYFPLNAFLDALVRH